MSNYIFEKFKKDEYNSFTNQLDISQTHKMKQFARYRSFNWGQVAEIIYKELENKYSYINDNKRLILSILTTAIEEPDMAIIPPFIGKSNFKGFLTLIDVLEKEQLVKRLSSSVDENGVKTPFVLYPTICPQKILNILEIQESQTLKMKNKVMERINT